MHRAPHPRTLHVERLHSLRDDQRIALEAFGAGFGHALPETFPIDLAYVDGNLKGWYAVHEHAVIYPALDPNRTSPRDFYRLFVHFLGTYTQRYGDPWMVTDPFYPEGGVTPETLERFGVEPLPKTVYRLAKTP